MLIYIITQILREEDKSVEIKVVFEIKFLKFTDPVCHSYLKW